MTRTTVAGGEGLRDLLVVADTHLTRRDEDLSAFVEFLLSRGAAASAVAHLGDLFNVWLGRPRFQMEHMATVLNAFRMLRARGVRTYLTEGNRDFNARRWEAGSAFDEVAEESMDLVVAGRRVRLAHGDLVNTADRQYRAWRRLARSRPAQAVLGLLPSRAGVRLAERLEERLRGTNTRHKSYFPLESAHSWGEAAHREGCQFVFVGHFHEERTIGLSPGEEGDPGGARMIVLPDWRSSNRYLYLAPDGSCGLESWHGSSGGAAPSAG
jgi:UDP-2,3-diacylglucosamine hydrolase